MKPDPHSVLSWLRQLSAARIVEVTPRAVLDVEALLRLPLAEDPAALGAGLASLLAHDETSWRQIEESFAGWCGSSRARVAAAEVSEAIVERAGRSAAVGAVEEAEEGQSGAWWRRWAAHTGGWRRWQWLLLLGVIVVAGVQGTLAMVGTVEAIVNQVQPKPSAGTAAVDTSVQVKPPVELPIPVTDEPAKVSFEPIVAPVQHRALNEVHTREVERPGPTWAVGMLLLGSALLAGLAARWWMSIAAYREDVETMAEAATQDRRRVLREVERLGVPYHIEVVPPLAPEVIEDAATLLARLTAPHPGWELDVEPTIARTIEAGGRVTPVYAPAPHRSPLVVLVDVEVGDHPDLHRVERLLARWQRGGLQLVRYDFAFRPVVLTPWPRGPQATLDELLARHEGAPLLVISRWVRPEDYSGQLDWLDALSRWSNRVWLDLDPHTLDERSADARAQREAIEGAGLSRFPFTARGLVACARTLKARGEHPAPLREEALRSIDELDVPLKCWAACASVVPDPIWPQLDAIRRELPELLAELPDARYVHRLIEWVQEHGEELDRSDRRARARAARLGQGERLVLSAGQRRALVAWLRRYDRKRGRGRGRKGEPGLHELARRLIVKQLKAANVEGDPLEALRRQLKIDLHEAVLDRRKAKALLGKWAHTAVAGELRAFMEDELAVQRLDRSGVHWGSGVRDAFAAWTGEGGGEWARPADVLRTRPWTPMRQRLVVGSMLAVAGSYGAWWWVMGEAVESTVVRWDDVRVSTTWEVKRPGEQSDEDAALRVPCEDHVALAGVAPMTMKCVVGGSFLMGSPPGEDGRYENEGPQHIAKVASFTIGEAEVTQTQWKAVMETEPFDCDYGCGGEHPAQNVSWNHAAEFMNRLTELENEGKPANQQLSLCYERDGESWAWSNRQCTGYRLPTETEWEYAARAGTETAYSFGADATLLDEHAWHDGNSGNNTHPVKQRKPNPLGLYDMHGNVWEWVWDWFGDYADDTEPGHVGPQSGVSRVLRGGSFGNGPRLLRSAFRGWLRPSSTDWFDGFRCVRGLLLPEPPSTP